MARKKNRDVDPIEEEADRDEGGGSGLTEADEPVEVGVEKEEEEEDPDAELDRERPNRAERRANRDRDYRTIREQRAAAEAEAKVLREELERSRAAMSALGQNRPERETGPAPEVEALEKELKGTYDAQERLNQEYDARVAAYTNARRAMPADELEKFKARATDLRRQEVRIIRRIDDAADAPQRRAHEEQERIRSRAPDVFGDERARTWAAGRYNQRVAENPNVDRDQLFQEVTEEARRVILGKRPPPDQAARQRASGMARGAGAAASGRSTIQMNGDMKKLARLRYPKLSEPDAYKKWAQTHGKEYLELERESGR
jgi:hypothetical protein